jgi:phosphoglycolate phosphatase
MIDTAAGLLGVARAEVVRGLREVHEIYDNTEHPFALLETELVIEALPGKTRRERYDALIPAFAEFDAVRSRLLRLFPGVEETLARIKEANCAVIGHTDATEVNVGYRAKILGLNRFLDAIYAPAFRGLEHPLGPAPKRADVVPIRRLGPADLKPNPHVLRQICLDNAVRVEESVYVGNSLMKDVTMALNAGAHAVWAEYGTRHKPEDWQLLLSVTHWKGDNVDQQPPEEGSYVTLQTFPELLGHFRFDRTTR